VANANRFNDPPEDGFEYVIVSVYARLIATDDTHESIDRSAFRSTGDSNTLHDRPSVVGPEPRLDFDLFPGGEVSGMIVVQATVDETGLMLVFEPLWDFSGQNRRFLSLEP
jgi:hypothetical protein